MNINKWPRWRVAALALAIVLYGVLIHAITEQSSLHSSLVGLQMLNYATFVIAVMAFLRPDGKHLVIAVTAASIFAISPVNAVVSHNDPPADPHLEQNCGAGAVIGVLVLVCGVYVCVKLVKFCKKKLPPVAAPPPPNGTNSASGLVVRSITGGSIPVLHLDESGTDMWDIAAYGWNDGDGYRYTVLVHATIESSTNLNSWDTLASLKAWCSQAHVMTVIYNPSGEAVATNYTTTGTNGIPMASLPSLGGEPAKAQYFRLKTPVL